ncbi:right-handed parallel beta-helix repeat-containing protein [Dyadobacter soli]|nr:right-handed parallel beta-helix repeat-containing protein [Dyadobacter soli]
MEIVVKAQLLPVNESIMFVFKESYAFRIKIVLPDGFVQTGGNYSDFVGTTLTASNPSVIYQLKGKFTSQVPSGKFILLRGSDKANNSSQLVYVESLPFSIKAASDQRDSKREMFTMQLNPQRVPYVRMDSLREGWGEEEDVVEIVHGPKSGKFLYDSLNTDPDDGALVVIARNSRHYVRAIDRFIDVRWFGTVGDGVADDTQALNAAAIAAKKLGKTLYLPKEQYRVNSKVTFYTDVESKATILMNKSTSAISIARTEPVDTLDHTNPGGLTKGSRKLGITGFKGATVLLRSTAEVMINRFGDGVAVSPYYKRQLIHLLDDEGNFDAPLQETYTDIAHLEIRVFPEEKPITINGLNIEAESIFYGQTPLSTTRSHVTMNGLRLVNKDQPHKGYIGVTVQNGYNITFNDCHVSGFNDDGNGGSQARLGYGFNLTDVYDVKFNRCHIDECKHTIMAAYATEVFIDDCILHGADDVGTTVFLQPLDAHWCHGMKVTNSRIYSKNGSTTGVSVAGGDIEIRNCKIYNCWSISSMSATTPEIRGSWIAEDNYIEISQGAANPNLLGAFSSGLAYGNTFTRALEHPKFVSIKNNRMVNPNLDKQLIIYRGITSIFENGKYITERLEIANNVAISGGNPTSVTTAAYLAVRKENISVTRKPIILIVDQPFRPQGFDSVATIRIASREKSKMSADSVFDYEVTVRNSTGFSTQVDADACWKFALENVDLLSTNGASTSGGAKSFFYQIYNCSIGRNLPSGYSSAILNAGSAPWMLFNSIVYSNLQLRTGAGSLGPAQITTFDDGIVVSKGNVVLNGARPVLFKTDNYVNLTYFAPSVN